MCVSTPHAGHQQREQRLCTTFEKNMGCCSAKPLTVRKGSARDLSTEDYGRGYGAPLKKPGFGGGGGGGGKLHRPQQQHDIPEFREETIGHDRKRRKEDAQRSGSSGSRRSLEESINEAGPGEGPNGVVAADGPERDGMPLVLRLSGGRKAPSFAVGL